MSTLSHPPRFDPVTPVHKAMRRFMFDVLTQVGGLDSSDIFEVDRCARQVERLIGVLPETAAPLTPFLQALIQPDAGARHMAADALYRELAQQVSAQLATQIQRESVETPGLQAVHSDPELRALRRRQLAAMREQELADALRWMGDALTPQELASFVDDLQASVDAQTFGCLLDTLRRHTVGRRWHRLMRELGLDENGTCPAPVTMCPDADRHGPARRGHRADRSRVRAQ